MEIPVLSVFRTCGDACGKCKPGEKKPAQAKKEYEKQNCHTIQKRDVYRNKVGKYMSHVPRKAAIVILIPVP